MITRNDRPSWNKRRRRTAIFSVNGCKKGWSNIQQITFNEKPIIDKKIPTQFLSEDFEPVALEFFGFENRENIIGPFCIIGRSNFQYKEQIRLFKLRVS